MAGIHFDITGDNKNFLQSLKGAESGVRNTSNAIEQYGSKIEGMFNSIRSAAELSLAGFTAKGFAEKVASIRGEFQKLEIGFGTMLGSAEKARALMDELTNLAATTPFDLKGVSDAARQLLAYGLEAGKVTDTLRRLGDISAGLGVRIGDLTYLYGTTMAQGRMYTQDLNQFTGRGIPMMRELAKQFGVAESEVRNLVTAGKVGFPEVEKVIKSLTDTGGQFGGLMEAQSKSILGRKSNIEDNIDMMFNEIGKSSEGAIGTVLDGVGYAVEHYKEFGSVLLGVIASYGEWKAAAMVVNAWNNMVLNQAKDIEAARQSELRQLADRYSGAGDAPSTEASTAAVEQNTIARNANKSAIDAEIAAIEASLKAKLAEAEAEYAGAAARADAASLGLDAANEALDIAQEKYDSVLSLGDADSIEAAELELNSAASAKNAAEKTLLTAREEVATAATNKNTAAERLNTLQTEADTVQKRANATATGIWAAVTKTATTAVRGLTAAIAANPVGALIVGITTVLSLIPMFTSETEEASAEVKKFGDAAVKQVNNVETLIAVLDTTSEKSKVHKNAIDDLIGVYNDYGISIDSEKDKLQQLIEKHDELIRKIRQEGEERQKANLIQSYEEGMTTALEEMRKEWASAYANAEFDMSGIFDDWDASDYQDKASQISMVANAIAQSEFEKLQGIVESGGEVTADKIQETITNAKKRIEEQSQKIAGSSLYMSSYDEIGNEIRHYIDIDYEGIMQKYADKVLNLASARRELVDEIKNTKGGVEDEAEAVDYSAMAFQDLFEKAYGAADAVSSFGDALGAGSDASDKAAGAIDGATRALSSLDGKTATPLVDTTSIGAAVTQTDTLIKNINTLSGSPMFNGAGGVPQFGVSAGNGGNFHFGAQVYGWNPLADGGRADAMREIASRVRSANTDKKVDDMLKDVAETLKNTEYGTREHSELLRLQQQLQERKKNANASNSGKTNTADKVRDEEAKLADMEQEEAVKRIRKAQDIADKLANVRIESEEMTADTIRARREQENREELQSIERERDDAVKAYVESERRIFEQREKIKKSQSDKYKERMFDASAVDTSLIESQYNEILERTREKQARDIAKEQSDALNAYLKEYGTFEQRKLAIAKEYEEKILQAATDGERLTLQEQLKSALNAVDMEALRRDIDWAELFGNMGGMLYEEMRANLENIEEYMHSDEFLGLGATDQRNIADLATQIRSQVGGGKSDFESIGAQMANLHNNMKALADAEEMERAAVEELQARQEEYGAAIMDGAGDVGEYKKRLDEANAHLSSCSESVKSLSSETEAAARALHSNVTNISGGLNSLASGLKDLKSGSLSGAFEGLRVVVASLSNLISGKLGDALGKFAGKLGGVYGEIAGAVLSVLDVLKDGISTIVSSFIDTILQAVNGILKDVLSGQGVKNILGSVVDGVGGILDTLSFGAIGSWGGGNKGDMEEYVSELLAANELLANAIDGLSSSIKDKDNTNAQSLEAYKIAIQAQREWEENQRNAINARASEYTNSGHGFLGLGGRSSFNYNLRDFDWSDFNEALKNGGFNKIISGANELWKLSPEEMRALRDFAPASWAKLINTGGESNPTDLINQYIEKAGVGETLVSDLNEKLTGYSWDGFKNSYLNALKELDSTNKDFSENLEEMLSNAILTSLVNERYKKRIQGIYEEIASASEDGIDKDEAVRIRKMNEELVRDMVSERDALIEAGLLYSNSAYEQSVSAGSFQNMGEETANELNGRFTAVQIHTADTAERMLTTIELLSGISLSQSSQNIILSEIRNMMIYANGYLDDMVKYAKMTYNQFGVKLDVIASNIKSL